MRPLIDTRKLVVIHTNGPIAQLGHTSGPILSPCNISLRTIVAMVQAGVVVYEINPNNYDEKVLLTIRNVQEDNFPDGKKYELPEEKKNETVSLPKEDMVTTKQDNLPNTHEEKPSVTITPGEKKEEVKEEKKEDRPVPKNEKSDFTKKK